MIDEADASPAANDDASPAANDDASRGAAPTRSQDPDDASSGFPPMMSPKALATLLEVTTLTLRRWREQGRGPAWHQFPGSNVIRYTRVDLLDWLAEHRIPPR